MRKQKVFLIAAALALCVFLTSSALTAGPLEALWDSGSRFLFNTTNVTVTGQAELSLDGTVFKTVQLDYTQDGYRSVYGLKLSSPKKDGGTLENGWTIVGDEDGNCYAMDVYTPGTYRSGTCVPCNTLLRRSAELDALTELGGLLVGQLEGALPEGAVTMTEAEGQKTVHLSLNQDQIPPLAASALNTAALYLSDRWFTGNHDRGVTEESNVSFYAYYTPTMALTDGTMRWTIKETEADFTLDHENRLAAAKGSLTVESLFWDGTARDVTVRFELTASKYGESKVDLFDPEAWQVVPQWAKP